MSSDETGLVRRRVTCSNKTKQSDNHNNSNSNNYCSEATDGHNNQEPDLFDNNDDTDSRNIKLSLLEEVFLLGLKDRQGYTSFWNDCISIGLRGCILAELVLRKRITLDKSERRRTSLSLRKVQVINTEHTGDALLDEALKHIHDTHPPESIHSWIYYLSGK
jgi:Golgi phosphoprotein 3